MALADRSTLAIRIACSGPVDLATLRALDALVATHPEALDLRFARACLLEDLGRLAAAARDYAAVLAHDPTHRGALINSATMAYVDGRLTEALGLYRRAADAAPTDVVALIDLANVLADRGAWDDARTAYERALAVEPEHPIAHYALAQLLAERDNAAAATHRARAFANPIVERTPSTSPTPVRVLVPIAADGGNLVTTLCFDPAAVEVTTVIADAYHAGWPLPPHDVIFNAVADADRSADALAAVARLCAASDRPCINAPQVVQATGRITMAQRLGALPGVVVPRIERIARATCTADALLATGFTFPLLLRTPGYHAGQHFVRVLAPGDLAPALDGVPGDELFAIAFIGARDDDGRYRKYRMLVIDGELVPLHLAIGRDWKVHYFSADNARRGPSRMLEARYLRDPRAHLGDDAYRALERIAATLGLDYGGIDFTLDATGNVVVFEANATFAIYLPDDDATMAYRAPAAEAAISAVRALIRSRALSAATR